MKKRYVSRVGIWKFLHRYERTKCVGRNEGSSRPSKITKEIKEIVERKMKEDDETTAWQIHKLLTDKGYGLSIATIVRCRKELGWTYRGKNCTAVPVHFH